MNEDYNTHVSEDIEDIVSGEIFLEVNRAESRMIGALSKLVRFLLSSQVAVQFGKVPEHPGIRIVETKNVTRIVRRSILILKCWRRKMRCLKPTFPSLFSFITVCNIAKFLKSSREQLSAFSLTW